MQKRRRDSPGPRVVGRFSFQENRRWRGCLNQQKKGRRPRDWGESMEYQDHIARVLAYIEANLTAELPLAALARVAGYSEYHFLRVFKEVCRLTPADYIRKRRLSEIAREAADSGRPISSIAFAYGFNSKENFTRAFKTEHCVSPTAYRTAGNSLKLYPPICL